MSDIPDFGGDGLDQARAAKKRAEKDLSEAVAERPETITTAARHVKLRVENHFAELTLRAFRRAS